MRRLAVISAAVALLLALPAAAGAHAVVVGTVPERGGSVERSPERVVFRFNEPVESAFGALRVFDAKGERVDVGATEHPGGGGEAVAVRLHPELPDGSYTATYRVVSADSHPISGGFVFTVGEGGAAPAASVSDLIDSGGAAPSSSVALGVVRGLCYLAIALVAGGLAFALAVWRGLPGEDRVTAFAGGAGNGAPGGIRNRCPSAGRNGRGGNPRPDRRGRALGEHGATATLARPAATAVRGGDRASEAFARRARTLALVAVAVGVVTSALGLVLQGATAAGGSSFWSALDSDVVRDVLGTRFGTVWGLRLLVWLWCCAALIVARIRRPPGRSSPVCSASLAALGLVGRARAGRPCLHAGDPAWLLGACRLAARGPPCPPGEAASPCCSLPCRRPPAPSRAAGPLAVRRALCWSASRPSRSASVLVLLGSGVGPIGGATSEAVSSWWIRPVWASPAREGGPVS